MKNTALLFIAFIILKGCTSISQPTASRALVEDQFVASFESLEQPLNAALSNSEVGAVLVIKEKPLVMGSKFVAATGLSCRKVSSERRGQDIYCLHAQGNWFRVNKVISEYSESDISGAGL